MKRSSIAIISFLLGALITSGAWFMVTPPRVENTFTGKHKIKGDGNTMSYTVQQIEELQQEMEKDCKKAIEKALKEAAKMDRKAQRKNRKSLKN